MISFKTPEEIYSFPPKWYPGRIHFDNYAVRSRTATRSRYGTVFVVAGMSTVIAMFLGTILRLQPGKVPDWRRASGQLDHFAADDSADRVVFPIFLLFVWLHLVDTYTGVILLYTAFNLP